MPRAQHRSQQHLQRRFHAPRAAFARPRMGAASQRGAFAPADVERAAFPLAGGRFARWSFAAWFAGRREKRAYEKPSYWVLGALLGLGFLAGLLSTFGDPTMMARVALGLPLILLLLRYHYGLLLAWGLLGMVIGSDVALFNGKNLDTALVVPTLLTMTVMPLRRTFQRLPALTVFCAYLAWVLLGMPSSPLSTTDFLKNWTLQLAGVAVAVITINELTSQRRLLGLVDAILVVGTLIALYGIYGYVTHQHGIEDPTTGDFRITSVFSFAPPLALMLSLMLPLAIYRVYVARDAVRRIGAVLIALLLVVAVALTFTRGALLSIPLSVLLACSVIPSRRLRVILLSGAVSVGAAAVFLATVVRVPLLARFFNADIGSLNGRTYLWLALIKNFDPLRIFGYGLGASDDFLTRVQVGVGGQPGRGEIASSASNLFVGTLFDSGLIGLALLAVMFGVLGLSLLAGIRRTRGEQRMLFLVATIALVNALIQSMEVSDLWSQAFGILFWVIMALPFAACWFERSALARKDTAALAPHWRP